jgi:twitching motility protein PilT
VTFENPVEMPLAGKHGEDGWCFQTEIGSEAKLAQHIERAHRYCSPNIIGIGEIRTKYAASEALRVALGSNRQLVVATIHGFSIITALERLLAWALEQDGEVACKNLAQTLVGIVYLELADHDKDKSRFLKVPEFLFLPFNDATHQIRTKIAANNLKKLEDEIRNQSNQVLLQGVCVV